MANDSYKVRPKNDWIFKKFTEDSGVKFFKDKTYYATELSSNVVKVVNEEYSAELVFDEDFDEHFEII